MIDEPHDNSQPFTFPVQELRNLLQILTTEEEYLYHPKRQIVETTKIILLCYGILTKQSPDTVPGLDAGATFAEELMDQGLEEFCQSHQIDPKDPIDSAVLAVLQEAIALQNTAIDTDRADEEARTDCITPPRLWRIAETGTQATADENSHLSGCDKCLDRIKSFQVAIRQNAEQSFLD